MNIDAFGSVATFHADLCGNIHDTDWQTLTRVMLVRPLARPKVIFGYVATILYFTDAIAQIFLQVTEFSENPVRENWRGR